MKELNSFITENILNIERQTYNYWEVIIVTNESTSNPWEKVLPIKVIKSGKVGPGRKRDIGAKSSSGNILVFLDDDSFPSENYLELAAKLFSENTLHAIGGPGITPETNGFFQKVSGGVFLSQLAGGNPERYISKQPRRFFTDWPSVNLAVRKDIFEKVGGYDTDLWPGEDTFFCSKLLEQNISIFYVPELIVFHHRRHGLIRHLVQVFAYGQQRGFLSKNKDPNSTSLKHFLPTFLCIFVMSNFLATVFPGFYILIALGWFIYFLSIIKSFFDIKETQQFSIAICSTLLIFPTHLAYGIGFIFGLSSSKPKVKLR